MFSFDEFLIFDFCLCGWKKRCRKCYILIFDIFSSDHEDDKSNILIRDQKNCTDIDGSLS